jgi:hypothetical protein
MFEERSRGVRGDYVPLFALPGERAETRGPMIGNPPCGGRRFEPSGDEASEDWKGLSSLLRGEGRPERAQRPSAG